MENMPLISVIVPVYKVEKYLDKCVSSITEQSYKNLEIILVDDGSPDNCGAMCDAWALKDDRIKVIHKENGGLSDARNAGMAEAQGEFIGFVDSDDFISPDMYKLLYENLSENGSDISACGVQMIWEESSQSKALTKEGSIVLNNESAMIAIIEESYLKQPVWYKLYKSELIKDIPFEKGKYHEDVFWSYQAMGRAKRVSVFDIPCYFYLQRAGSIMDEGYSLKRLDALDAKIARTEYIEKNFPQLLVLAKRDLWFSCIYSSQMLSRFCSDEIQKEGFKKIDGILKRYPVKINLSVPLGIKQRIWLVMAKISFKATYKIRNKLGIGF